MSEDTIISIPYDKFRAIETTIGQLRKELEQAHAAVDAARMEDSSGRLPAAMSLVRASLRVIQFAISNLPVTCYPGWPYHELELLAVAIPTLPGLTDVERELGTIFAHRADDMAQLELGRAAVAMMAHELGQEGIPTGALCSICGEAQVTTKLGVTCEHGHENAPGVPVPPLPTAAKPPGGTP
jgi:hypothetical protein